MNWIGLSRHYKRAKLSWLGLLVTAHTIFIPFLLVSFTLTTQYVRQVLEGRPTSPRPQGRPRLTAATMRGLCVQGRWLLGIPDWREACQDRAAWRKTYDAAVGLQVLQHLVSDSSNLHMRKLIYLQIISTGPEVDFLNPI